MRLGKWRLEVGTGASWKLKHKVWRRQTRYWRLETDHWSAPARAASSSPSLDLEATACPRASPTKAKGPPAITLHV